MISLRSRLAGIGEPKSSPFALRADFGRRTPASVRALMDWMLDPHVSQWHKVGVALSSENTALSEEAQGATTDGKRWYVSSNGSKQVVAFDDAANRVATFAPAPAIVMKMWTDQGKPDPGPGGPLVMGGPLSSWNPHFGAPTHHDGWILIPIQGPRGIWRFRTDGSGGVWRKAADLPEDDLFPWCAVHPVTGILYTSNYDTPTIETPKKIYAYDRLTLTRLAGDDITLGPAPIFVDRVQGGTFTLHGKLILVRSDYNAVFCFSSLNGHCFGAAKLGDFGSDGSEVESVTVRSWQLDGVHAQVHISELDNDLPSEDDFYLHSFQVPDPTRL